MNISKLSELELIEHLRTIIEREIPAGPDGLPLGIGDDTAVISPPAGGNELFTIDTMVEGVHFLRSLEPPEDLGFRLVAVNASDIAAMGGKPSYGVVSLALPGSLTLDWFESLGRGLREGAEAHRLRLLGGDTTSSPGKVILSMAMLGTVGRGREVRRDGARVGDVLVVTGSLGKGRAGREALGRKDRSRFSYEIECYLRPRARIAEGLCLAEIGKANAMIDVSDGLASEAYHLAGMSGVTIELAVGSVPVSEGVRVMAGESGTPAIDYALYGGEDYELLAAIPANLAERTREEFGARNLAPPTEIGRVTGERTGVWLVTEDGRRVAVRRLGYGHFGRHRI